ncbi:o-succinylbenzoate--CoA ligase [Vibrio aestuarianus]|uniref:o-succinylbenzoate--CoA ligase n=1 Tax=Vibrio aestuarianus TaxID=28171 RepID=UPI0015599701|nr:o-succinylbenzoate--CoA ligase [Vibrio aestuarianus]NGZ13823.1 o-succinylbenzoate--CoA ligase [Vibrio aestuarianus]NKZ49971.1 o-succinylbenzoate--CoA ligase [Vibrio aestuarianus]
MQQARHRLSSLPWEQKAQQVPNSLALITPSGDYTWSALTRLVNGYADALSLQGLKVNDVLTLVGKNSAELLLLYLASLKLGVICAITMPQPYDLLKKKLNTLYKPDQTAWLWLGCGAALSKAELAALAARTVLVRLEDSEKRASSTAIADGFDVEQLSSIVFTSGSTGEPKAVVHTSAQHFASASGLLTHFSYTEQDTWLLSLPMYHVSGLAIIYRWLSAGACLKVGSGDLSQDIQQVTHASLVATQLKRLLDSGQALTLTHVLLGGSHIPYSLSQQAAQLGIETWLGYGMTEAASTVTAKRVDNQNSAGYLLPNRQLKVEQQRIWIGGDTLASGYYHQGTVTPFVDAMGWFDSKDLGQWLGNELRIIGRADNQFISGGENIHCEEIEAVLNRHLDIEQAMVVAVKDAEFGCRSVAVVRGNLPLNQQEIEQWLAGKLDKFKWPVAYFLMPEALTESGIKVSRSALKAWLSNHQTQYRIAD